LIVERCFSFWMILSNLRSSTFVEVGPSRQSCLDDGAFATGLAGRKRGSYGARLRLDKNGSLDYGVDDDTGRSRQWLRSRLCAVHLEDICGDVHCGVISYVLELEARVAYGYLKPIYELGYGFLAPTVEKSFASQWRNIVWISDEFLISFG